MNAPSPLHGRYYPPVGHARASPVVLAPGEEPGSLTLRLTLDGVDTVRVVSIAELSASERFASATRNVHLSDGSVIEVDDARALSALLAQIGKPDAAVTRWQQSWRAVLWSLALSAIAMVAGYIWLLPWAADRAAAHIPASWAQALDRAVLSQLTGANGLEPSTLPKAEQERLRAKFLATAGALNATGSTAKSPAIAVHFYRLGNTPNAFALPGGSIVFLDGLVQKAPDDDALIGVFAHEYGHVQHRHGMRTLLRTAAISAVATWYFGDFTSLASAAILVTELRYSRAFETEADDTALAVMRATHANPKSLATLFRRMHESAGDSTPQSSGSRDGSSPSKSARRSPTLPEFFSTHPDIERRIERFEAAQ